MNSVDQGPLLAMWVELNPLLRLNLLALYRWTVGGLDREWQYMFASNAAYSALVSGARNLGLIEVRERRQRDDDWVISEAIDLSEYTHEWRLTERGKSLLWVVDCAERTLEAVRLGERWR